MKSSAGGAALRAFSRFSFFAVCAPVCLLAGAPAFGQQQDLPGSWELIGYMCADGSGDLVPVGDSTQEFTFRQGGEFQAVYHRLSDAGDDMTYEEYREGKIERANERVRRWHQEDVDRHEEICRRQHGDQDFCSPRGKKELYDEWWERREKELEKMLEESFGDDDPPSGPCEIIHRGEWRASGNRLTINETSVEATASCGLEGDPGRRISARYYFDGGDLHVVMPAHEASREYCGSGDWAAILFRK